MSIETFENLIEIQGLLNQKSKHLAVIEEENQRIEHLNKISIRKGSELTLLSTNLATLHIEMANLESRINTINLALQKMKEDFYTLKSEKEVETFKARESLLIEEQNQIEESLFLKLENEEKLNIEISDAKSFIEGIEKTKQEIKTEIENVTSKEQDLVSGYQLRIDALVAELPKDALINFNAAIKKYPIKFLSFVETFRCGVCRYEIERNTVALIDRAQVFELCGSCGRLLAPKHLPARL